MSSSTIMTGDNMDVTLATMINDDIINELLTGENLYEYIRKQLELVPPVSVCGHILTIQLVIEDNELDFFMQKAKEDLCETSETIAQGLKELKELVAGEPDLRVIDSDLFYTIFLRPCKWYAQSAFSLMKRHFRFRQNYPHIFSNLIPSEEKAIFYSGLIYPLPQCKKDRCRIFVIEVGKRWNPRKVSLDQLFKGLILNQMAAMLEPKTQITGGRVIIDLEGLSLSQVTYFSPSFAKMTTDYVQKTLPIRIKSIHIINQPFIFNIIFAMFKPLLQEKWRKRLHFHGTDRESLMTFIDKRTLLKKHGGELDITDTSFTKDIWKFMCFFDPIFMAYSKLGYPNKK